MKCIVGIESTAHTFGVGILSLEKKPKNIILSNIKDSWTANEGGMIPLEVRAHHSRVADSVFQKAMDSAGIKEEDINCIAFSSAPGLAPCLLEGMNFSKKLAKKLGVDLIPVNHCVAHLTIGETIGTKDPVMLYASGANTQIIAFEGGKFRIFGETLDLGVGNFIDTIARTMGLGFPGGPKIQKLAEDCKDKEELLDLPYSVKGMDVSFSGMQTKIRNLLEKNEDKSKIAYSLQEIVFAMLIEVAERALAHTGKTELLIGGGVGCNLRFQEMCKIMCKDRGVKFFCPTNELLVDNGAMIGYLGLKMFRAGMGTKEYEKIDISPRERTDEVDALW